MALDVAAIRSALQRQISPPSPTPLERATAAARVANPLARAYLAGSAEIEAQLITTRLAGDIAFAQSNPAQVNAAYNATTALALESQNRRFAVNTLA